MAKLRLSKNELKKQKESLKRYYQYLPTLILKKKQLQTEIFKIHQATEELRMKREYVVAEVYEWVDVFSEDVGIKGLIKLKEIVTTTGNIAGIDVPVFENAVFNEKKYDYARTPIWLDYAVEAIRDVLTLHAKIDVLKRQDALVREERRIATQRVNLFEEIMIPETRRNISKIQIYLGDMQTAAVVTGKIAKAKILKSESVQV